MKLPKHIVGKKFVMNNGRLGKIISKIDENHFNVRCVGRTENRNMYSYSMTKAYLEKRVVMWFEHNEIKFMNKRIVNGKRTIFYT